MNGPWKILSPANILTNYVCSKFQSYDFSKKTCTRTCNTSNGHEKLHRSTVMS